MHHPEKTIPRAVIITIISAILLYYSITNISALRQPRTDQRYGRVIPLLGLIGCLVMSVSLPLNVILVGVGLLIAGFLLRFLFHRIWNR